MQFLSARELWGLSLCDICTEGHADLMDDVISKLHQIRGLASLDLSGNYLQESAVSALLRFLADSTSISEIAYDRSGITDTDRILAIYGALARSRRILALRTPIGDLAPVSGWADGQRIEGRLNAKRPFSTHHQRLALYMALAGQARTRLARPIGDDDWRPLGKTFRNPIPAISDRAEVKGPLGVLLREKVAAPPGVTPPTVAPAQAAATPFVLPAIYGTMDPANQAVQYEQVDLAAIGEQLAVNLQRYGGQIKSIFSEQIPEDPREVAMAPFVGLA
jgi:hypothetical protein